jgi:hypothetical protein
VAIALELSFTTLHQRYAAYVLLCQKRGVPVVSNKNFRLKAAKVGLGGHHEKA